MNKKTLIVGALVLLVSGVILFPTTSSAFWPFDGWFKQGEVKGEQTEVKKKSVRNLFQKVTPTPTIELEDERETDEKISETKIKEAVKNRRMTEAQRRIMLEKLAEIKAKRLEVKKLQEAFVAWMKANRIDSKTLEGTPTPTPAAN